MKQNHTPAPRRKGGIVLKRICLLLLTAALLFSLLLLPVSGAVSISFVAFNDLVPLTLSGDQRPFYSGGALYVPYTVFNASQLSFYPSYSVSDKTLTLFSRNKRLVFDLSAGTVSDEEKAVSSVSAISRSGTVFLPAAFCAGHFGVTVSDLTSKDGYQIVRFKTGTEVYDDGLFVEKAENIIAYHLSQATGPATPPPTTPSVPVTPTAPTPATPDEPEQEPARIYLAVTGGDMLANALSALDRYRLKATFFLTAKEIEDNEPLVRRLTAEGHYVGLTITPDAEDPAMQLTLADQALNRATQSRSVLTLLPERSVSDELAARYRVFSQPATRLTATEAARAYGETRLFICDGGDLTASLQTLAAADCQFLPLRETSQLDA